jgi:hypothetical protein
MTNEQTIGIVVGVVVVAVVFLLRGKIFSIKADKGGFQIDNKPPEQKPGINVEGAIARKGDVAIENNQGDGIAAKNLDAAKNVKVTNNPVPKN